MKKELGLRVIIVLAVVMAAAQAGFADIQEPIVEQLTFGDVNNSNIAISGSFAVWQGKEPNGGPWEIFFFDGNSITQLTDSNTDNIRPQISGKNIVWQGRDPNQGDWEIFWSNGKAILQITDNNFDDVNPRVSGSRIFWKGFVDGNWQIFTAAFPVSVSVKVSPRTINLKSNGKTITVALSLGTLKAVDVNAASLRLNGQIVALRTAGSGSKLIIKFDRQAVQAILSVGDSIEITITGKMKDGTPITATDTVRVINPGKK